MPKLEDVQSAKLDPLAYGNEQRVLACEGLCLAYVTHTIYKILSGADREHIDAR